MINLQLSDIAKNIGAKFVGEDHFVDQVFTDSRTAKGPGLFIALKGIHFDAHDFLPQIVEQGVTAVVVEKETALPISQIIVEDSTAALGAIAGYNRSLLSAKLIAITGSSGKTTVKEMVASILQHEGKVLATKGNFNNEIGAPLTLLRMDKAHDFGVIELGANHAGEIAYTASITKPDVAMINNVAAAHLEGFGDLQGVSRAKSEIYDEISHDGISVVNLDDKFSPDWLKKIKTNTLTFSKCKAADVEAKNIKFDKEQRASFELNFDDKAQAIKLALAGEHNISNALAAAACCIALNVSLENIAKGLASSPTVNGRLNSHQLANGCRLIDDSYNANLDSMKAAVRFLSRFPTKKIMVIGDMGELGEFGRQCHEELGIYAAQENIDQLYSCGVLSKFTQTAFSGNGRHFSSQHELIKQLKQEANRDVTILVKGSRSAHMENVVNALMDEPHQEEGLFASTKGED